MTKSKVPLDANSNVQGSQGVYLSQFLDLIHILDQLPGDQLPESRCSRSLCILASKLMILEVQCGSVAKNIWTWGSWFWGGANPYMLSLRVPPYSRQCWWCQLTLVWVSGMWRAQHCHCLRHQHARWCWMAPLSQLEPRWSIQAIMMCAWLIPHTNSLGSSGLKAATQHHLGFQCPMQLCWQFVISVAVDSINTRYKPRTQDLVPQNPRTPIPNFWL